MREGASLVSPLDPLMDSPSSCPVIAKVCSLRSYMLTVRQSSYGGIRSVMQGAENAIIQ